MGHYGGRGMTAAAMVIVKLAQLRCVVVFCVSIVRKLLPRGKTAREKFCHVEVISIQYSHKTQQHILNRANS